jgi:CheY-like chemotaxis protein
MDCQMPVLDGFEATRRIRSLADQSKREVPVVAISASMMGSEYERCLASGMDAVVPKPISQSTLFAVIEQFTKEPVTSTGESKEQSWSGVDSTSNQPLE